MNISLPTENKRFQIRVGVRAFEPMTLGVTCSDISRQNSDYIRRKVPFKEQSFLGQRSVYREFTLPFPVSPDKMNVKFYDKLNGGNDNFSLEKFKIEKMPNAEVWAEPDIHRFIDFNLDFSQRAGYLSTGIYDSNDGDFLIQYLPTITNEFGSPLVTPARTNRRTGRIQVSQSAFKTYTVPVRIVVLFHERFHFQIPTRREKPADLNALRVYLDLGFPRTEGVYASTQIFLNHPDTVGKSHLDRVEDNVAFIDKYSYRKEAWKNATV